LTGHLSREKGVAVPAVLAVFAVKAAMALLTVPVLELGDPPEKGAYRGSD
jgi:hypothetical protein